MDIFLRNEESLGPAKAEDGQREAERYPDEMNPPGRGEHAVDDERGDDQDCADDEDQEGRRAVTDIEAGLIEAAGATAVGETNPARE
jgi:hypothetical protein